MTIYYRISLLDIDLGPEAFEEIARICPDGQEGPVIVLDLPYDDPVMQQVLSALARHGWQPRNYMFPLPDKSFIMDAYRQYTPEDLLQAEYLVLNPMDQVSAVVGDDGSLILIPAPEERPRLRKPIISAWIRNVVVTSALRVEMEAMGFVGLAFRPASLRNPRTVDGPRHWHLTPSVLMPPLGERMLRLNNQMQPHTGDPLDTRFFREGAGLPEALMHTPELHYGRASIEALGTFDTASTYERTFGGAAQQIVVSQRVYQFCVHRGLKIDWHPIRLDPI